MLSYLEAAKSIANDSVFARGVRLYLEGHILGHGDLHLPSWRVYKVNGTYDYDIKIPLIHQILPQDSWHIATDALADTVTCDCPYFIDGNGICKHIVAVCASLDQEFRTPLSDAVNIHNPNTHIPTAHGLLDALFEVEYNKVVSGWLNDIDTFFERRAKLVPYSLRNMIKTTVQHWDEYATFVAQFQDICLQQLKTWEGEKQLLLLFEEMLYSIDDVWFEIIANIAGQFDTKNQTTFTSKTWLHAHYIHTGGDSTVMQTWVLKRSENIRLAALEQMSTRVGEFSNAILEYALKAELYDWVRTHYEQWTPHQLLRIVSFMPDEINVVELRLFNHIRVWSDFLIAGKYGDLIAVMNAWFDACGQSDMYMQALKYIVENHPKKKRLIQEISV